MTSLRHRQIEITFIERGLSTVIHGSISDKDSRIYNFLTNISIFLLKSIYFKSINKLIDKFDILTVRDNFRVFVFSEVAIGRNNVIT